MIFGALQELFVLNTSGFSFLGHLVGCPCFKYYFEVEPTPILVTQRSTCSRNCLIVNIVMGGVTSWSWVRLIVTKGMFIATQLN